MIINYQKILQKNLEKVLYDVLIIISIEGLKSGHHLYITIKTNSKGVKIPGWLKKKYPKEITIVIQYEYWNLNVKKDNFSIDLSFNNINANLKIPFSAVLSFADPFANFGLTLVNKKIDQDINKITKKESSKIKDRGKIITLDKFRRS